MKNTMKSNINEKIKPKQEVVQTQNTATNQNQQLEKLEYDNEQLFLKIKELLNAQYKQMKNNSNLKNILEQLSIKRAAYLAYKEKNNEVNLASKENAMLKELLDDLNFFNYTIEKPFHILAEDYELNISYQEQDAVLTCFNGEEVVLSSILGEDALIFESIVSQTKQFADFNESSVNTVRFMTTLWPDGTARVIATWFKVGRAGKCVDNAGSGGNVDAGVDSETGKIYNVVQFDGWRRTKAIDRHPDSGSLLNGVVIEHWDAIKAEVIKFQQAFPYCKAAGWDIAITDEGPVIIEVNDFWDRTGQFFIKKGWRKEIRDCYLAWKETGKNYSTGELRLPLSDKKLIRLFSKY